MKHTFKVGDFARSVESGWIGKIVEVFKFSEPDGHCGICEEDECRMVGVNLLAHTIGGSPINECIDHDDVQWFSADDLRLVKIKEAQRVPA